MEREEARNLADAYNEKLKKELGLEIGFNFKNGQVGFGLALKF